MNQNPNNKKAGLEKDELEFKIEDLSIDDTKVDVKINSNSSFQTDAAITENKDENTQDNNDESLVELDDQDQTDQNEIEDIQDNADEIDNEEENLDELKDGKTQSNDKKDDSNSDKPHKDDGKNSENDKSERLNNPNNPSGNNAAKKNNQSEDKPSESDNFSRDKIGDNNPRGNNQSDKGDNNSKPKTGLDKKREDLKNERNNRPKNFKGMKDRIKNGAKNYAKNFANGAKERAKEGFENSNLGQSIDKAKNAIDKGKKVANGAKKAGKTVAETGKAAINIIKVAVAAWPVTLTVILISVICACIFALLPGTNGDTNVELSNYSKADQKTIAEIRKIFSKYPNADATLAMATVVYPYNNILWSDNTINLASKKYYEDLEDEALEENEEDDYTEEIIKEDSDKIADDMYLDLFKKYSYRKKLKTLLKKYSNEGEDSYYTYLKDTYFLKDKGYKSMFKDSLNVDALKDSIIEDLKNKKELFTNYVYNNMFCSVSFQSAGTVEIDDLLKSNILVDVKVESCTTSNVQNCESKYNTPLTLDKYVMSVTYEEIGVSASSDIEKVKAQMIASKSYVLSRWKSMGWKISKTEDGSYVIPIRSNTNDQDFCDIDTGCQDKLKGAKRPAIDEDTRALMVKAWDETKNLLIYDNKEKQPVGTYCANRSGVCSKCEKGTCLSHAELGNYKSGTLYTTILGEQYSNLSLITLEEGFASITIPGQVTCIPDNMRTHGIPDDLFTYYYQTDYPNVAFCGATNDNWQNGCSSDEPPGKNTICTSGCGVTSLAMIISNLSDEKLDPIMANNEASTTGACTPGAGSNNLLITEIPKKHTGFKVENVEVSRSGADKIISALKNGALVAANVQSQSPFTNGGHWILLRGIASNGEVKVADPFSKEKTLSNTYKIYDFVDKNWLIDNNGYKHSWFIVYGPKSPLYATKLSSTGEPGVTTGILQSPFDTDGSTKLFDEAAAKLSFENNCGSSKTLKRSDCKYHGGNDLPVGLNTKVYAVDGGKVIRAVSDKRKGGALGLYIAIENTYQDKTYVTVYQHLNKILVSNNDVISKGQLIGLAGKTGDSTGVHLHLEIIKGPFEYKRIHRNENYRVNPYDYISGSKKGQVYFDD